MNYTYIIQYGLSYGAGGTASIIVIANSEKEAIKKADDCCHNFKRHHMYHKNRNFDLINFTLTSNGKAKRV